MPSMYNFTIPPLKRALNNLAHILKKGEAHAEAKGIAPEVFFNARLFPDMYPLSRQVQIATDMSKGAAARLAGVEVPSYEDSEATFADLQQDTRTKLEFSWLVDTGEKVTVKAKFYNPHPEGMGRNFVKDRLVQQGQWGQIIEECNEYLIYQISVNGTVEIKPWLRSFGSSCEVMAPTALREEMIEEWKELQARYESF